MEKLVDLPDVTSLSPSVVRILGQNPGKFTLQGTNTYLIGRRPPFILVDLGEGEDSYTKILCSHLSSVRSEGAGRVVSDVIITHEHADHFGGMLSVLSALKELSFHHAADYKGPRVHKFPSPPSPAPMRSSSGSVTDAESRAYDHSLQFTSVLYSIPAGSDILTPAETENRVHNLVDGQILETEDGSAQLRVVHTPGHTPDSICLLLSSPSSEGSESKGVYGNHILFTADSVLGQGTAVFEDLSTYLKSLSRLISPDFTAAYGAYEAVYPGHGPVVADGPGMIRTYIKHRLEREAQIAQVLGELQVGSPGGVKVWDVVKMIYKHYPENLWMPAARGVMLHVKKLEVDGKARCIGGQGIEQSWLLTSS